MRLSEKLINQFRQELFKFERSWHKEIYQIKTIDNGIGGDLFFSCRFKTPSYKTYILSILIALSGDKAHVRSSIHELCERRWFTKPVMYRKEILEESERLDSHIKNKKVMDYYQQHKHFPYNLMANVFVEKGMKTFIVDAVNELELLK